jgi:hypothetical protein
MTARCGGRVDSRLAHEPVLRDGVARAIETMFDKLPQPDEGRALRHAA